MPVTIDFNESELFGPIYRKGRDEGLEQGLQKGLKKGLKQGLEQGREQGYKQLLTRQLGARFGELPSWVNDRLEAATDPELEDLGMRLLSAQSLDSLFQR